MQNTVRWRFNRFWYINHWTLITIWTPWSNESDANLEDSACTARMLYFFPMESRCSKEIEGYKAWPTIQSEKQKKRWEQTTDYWLSAAVHETKSPFSIQCCLILFWWITIMKWQLWTNCYQYGFLRNIYVVRIRVVCNLPKYPDIQVSGYHISTFLIKPYLVYCRKFANPYLVPKLSLWPWFCIPLRENYLFVVQDQPLSVSKRW